MEGGASAVDEILKRTGTPLQQFDYAAVGGEGLTYTPRFELVDANKTWKIVVIAERSAFQDTDLFVLRDYTYGSKGDIGVLEQQFAFVEKSTWTILDWLGIDPSNLMGGNESTRSTD
jgi:hypothetical protein